MVNLGPHISSKSDICVGPTSELIAILMPNFMLVTQNHFEIFWEKQLHYKGGMTQYRSAITCKLIHLLCLMLTLVVFHARKACPCCHFNLSAHFQRPYGQAPLLDTPCHWSEGFLPPCSRYCFEICPQSFNPLQPKLIFAHLKNFYISIQKIS